MSDAAYNAESRLIEVKFDIHLGSGAPLHVTKENYLVDATILEEAQGNSKAVLDDVSSNEITLTLYNDNNIFTPTNASSPYYGYMKKDTVIEVFGRATTLDAEAEWEPLGKYYVKQWSTSSSSMTASITANDVLYNVFDAPVPVYEVAKNVTVHDFYQEFFRKLNVTCEIDESFSSLLPYAYISADNKAFLSDLAKGTLAMCYGNRLGGVSVLSRVASKDLRATLTDADQIISVDATQSIEAGYDGASITRNAPQESSIKELVYIKDTTFKEGDNILNNITSSAVPIVRLSYGNVSSNANARLIRATSTPNDVSIIVSSPFDTLASDVTIYGTSLDVVSTTVADTGNNLLALNSMYVQTEDQADQAIEYVRRVTQSSVPMLTVSTRGNFGLKIGDKVRINSSRFKTDYTGVIIRNEYTYTGGLSCTLTLMDYALFEEVS